MKVLQITQDEYLPVICGNAMVVENFREMMDGIIENYILTENKDRPIYQKLANGAIIFNTHNDISWVERDAQSIVESLGIDVIIIHDPGYRRMQKLIEGNPSVKKVLVSHFFAPAMISNVHEMYDKIIVFQKTQADYYREHTDIPKNKIFFMPQPMNTDIFHPYDVEKKPRSLIYAGRLIEQKGPHLILPYLRNLDATYTMVGPVKPEFKVALENEINKLGISDRVEILSPLLGRELAKKLSEHRIYILPSSSDCYSLAMSEAMCCGLTCTALHIDDAFTWMQGMGHIAKGMDDMARFIKRTLDAEEFVSHHKEMETRTSIKNLRQPFCSMLKELCGVKNQSFTWRNV